MPLRLEVKYFGTFFIHRTTYLISARLDIALIDSLTDPLMFGPPERLLSVPIACHIRLLVDLENHGCFSRVFGPFWAAGRAKQSDITVRLYWL